MGPKLESKGCQELAPGSPSRRKAPCMLPSPQGRTMVTAIPQLCNTEHTQCPDFAWDSISSQGHTRHVTPSSLEEGM